MNRKGKIGMLFLFLILCLLAPVTGDAENMEPFTAPKGDVNGDGVVDLKDALLSLKVLSGFSTQSVRPDYPTSGADLEATISPKIGYEETLYILQRIAGRNRPPVADIGPDRHVSVGSVVNLDAGRTQDPDNDPLSFSWSIRSKPSASQAVLSDSAKKSTTFVADLPGAYELTCTATDGREVSALKHIRVIAVEDGSATVTPLGGRYLFSNGIELDVPAGAVTTDTEITIRFLDHERAASILEHWGLASKRLMVAFHAAPAGLLFSSPVTIILPSASPQGMGFPFLFEIDLEKGTCSPSNTKLTWDPASGKVSLVLDRLTAFCVADTAMNSGKKYGASYSLEANTVWRFTLAASAHSIPSGTRLAEGSSEERFRQDDELCKLGKIHTETGSRDAVYSKGECQIQELKTKLQYLDCGTEWNDYFREITAGCKPSLSLEAPSRMDCASQAEVVARVKLGEVSIPSQYVLFSLSGPASLDEKSKIVKTSSTGEAKATISSGSEPGPVALKATGALWVPYIFQLIVGQVFTGEKGKAEILEKTADICVACELQIDEMQTTNLKPGDKVPITARLTCGGRPVPGQAVTFSVSGGGTGIVNPSTVTTQEDGSAITTLTVSDGPNITVTAEYVACDNSAAATRIARSVDLFARPTRYRLETNITTTSSFPDFGLLSYSYSIRASAQIDLIWDEELAMYKGKARPSLEEYSRTFNSLPDPDICTVTDVVECDEEIWTWLAYLDVLWVTGTEGAKISSITLLFDPFGPEFEWSLVCGGALGTITFPDSLYIPYHWVFKDLYEQETGFHMYFHRDWTITGDDPIATKTESGSGAPPNWPPSSMRANAAFKLHPLRPE